MLDDNARAERKKDAVAELRRAFCSSDLALYLAFDAQVRNPGTTNERFLRQLVQELQ